MFFCAAFEECRADIALLALFFFLYGNIKPKRPNLFFQRWKVCTEVKGLVRSFKRKIQIFRKPVKSIEDAQSSSAIKCGFVKKARTGQPAQNDLLYDLFHGVLFIIDIFHLIAFQHLLNGRIHFIASLSKNRASLHSLSDTCR